MIDLSMEIPTSQLRRWTPRTELDFVLAHKALKDASYARFFRQRPKSRRAILDNSTHEFGRPLAMGDLEAAAKLVRADYVVAPDIVNASMTAEAVNQNVRWVDQTLETVGQNYMTAAVLCGLDEVSIRHYLSRFSHEVAMLCFTFHNPYRLQWWKILAEFNDADNEDSLPYDRVHLLGVSSLEELRAWVEISEKNPDVHFSVDTSKPLKWGAQLRKLDEIDGSLQGGQIKSKEVLELEDWTDAQIECVEHNIDVLRKVCRGEA